MKNKSLENWESWNEIPMSWSHKVGWRPRLEKEQEEKTLLLLLLLLFPLLSFFLFSTVSLLSLSLFFFIFVPILLLLLLNLPLFSDFSSCAEGLSILVESTDYRFCFFGHSIHCLHPSMWCCGSNEFRFLRSPKCWGPLQLDWHSENIFNILIIK